MLKKVMAGFLAVALTASMAACSSSKGGESGKTNVASLKDDGKTFLQISDTEPVKTSVAIKKDLCNDMIKEKFNMKINRSEISTSDYMTKMSLIFASGGSSVPDTFNLRPEWKLNEWANSGYLKGFTRAQVEKYLPHYVASFGKNWDIVCKSITSPDGKIYWFPGLQATTINMAWMYRTDTMKQLGLKMPTTTDEMFNVLKTIKEKTGRIPYVSASPNQVLWAFSGFMQSFGIPELAVRQLSYVDPVSKKFVSYAFSENNYRDFLKYMNKLYKNGLIWKEFSTASTDQVKKFNAQGNGYVLWGYPQQITTYEDLSKTVDKDATWDWSKDMVSADSKITYYKTNDLYNAGGGGFSANISEQKLARLLKYKDWQCTAEGERTMTFGKEGVTYEMKNGTPAYTDNMVSPVKAKGDVMAMYGFNGYMVQDSSYNKTYYPVLDELQKTFSNRKNYYTFITPAMLYTDQENSEMTDITTSINDSRDEYAARFIMGQLDPNNDSAWKEYLDTLNKLGLKKLQQIRSTVYKRGQSSGQSQGK